MKGKYKICIKFSIKVLLNECTQCFRRIYQILYLSLINKKHLLQALTNLDEKYHH